MRIYLVNIYSLGIDIGNSVFSLSPGDLFEYNGSSVNRIITKTGEEITIGKSISNLVWNNVWMKISFVIEGKYVIEGKKAVEDVTEQIKRDRTLNKILE